MFLNYNSDLLLYLLLSVGIIVMLVIIGTIGISIRMFVKSNKEGKSNIKKSIIITILHLALVGVSWVLNFGWLRFFGSILLIPFVHGVIFFWVNLFTWIYIDRSKKLKIMNLLFCTTYLLSYLLLPDGGDSGGMYVFFGLVQNDLIVSICAVISNLASTGHIVLLILQIIELIKIKKTTSAEIIQ